MNKSECLISTLMLELDSLESRIKNINQAYSRTSNNKLRDRLIFENGSISKRIGEISNFAEFLVDKSKEKISLSKLLLEMCRRSIYEINNESNLFFL